MKQKTVIMDVCTYIQMNSVFSASIFNSTKREIDIKLTYILYEYIITTVQYMDTALQWYNITFSHHYAQKAIHYQICCFFLQEAM